MIVLVLSDNFEFVLAIFHLYQSPSILSVIVPIPTFLTLFLASSIRLFSTLEIVLANIHRDVRVFGCAGCPSMQHSGLSLPFCLCVRSF